MQTIGSKSLGKFLAFLGLSVFTFSMIVNPVWAVPESDLLGKFQTEVEPYFETGVAGTLTGKGQVNLAYRVFEQENEKAALVLLPGRGEPIHKYAEVIYDLRASGISIYILEHRGQGESDLVEGVRAQFVQSYDDYVSDLNSFVSTVVSTKPHSKLFLMGHSMGGAIGALYAERYPATFDALIFSAPMFDMNTPPYSKSTAKALGQLACSIGFGKWTAGKDSWQVSSSQARSELGIQLTSQYSKGEPKKITYRWVLASLVALGEIQERSKNLELPILLLQAENDLHVPAEGQNQFCKNAAHCKKVVISNSFHEILMETDSIRDGVLRHIEEFITSLLASTE